MTKPVIRPARPDDAAAIVAMWHAGWHDAHAALVPPDILVVRQIIHFETWLTQMPGPPFVAETDQVIGFVAREDDELGKLYVTDHARGTGIAQTLMHFGEAQIAAAGYETAVLHCTAGNDRAQRFYEREGWTFCETFSDHLWHPDPAQKTSTVQTRRYTKALS